MWDQFVTEIQEVDNLELWKTKVKTLKRAVYTTETQENFEAYMRVTKELVNNVKELKENWKFKKKKDCVIIFINQGILQENVKSVNLQKSREKDSRSRRRVLYFW